MSAREDFGQALWRRHTQTALTSQARDGTRATFGETVNARHARFVQTLMRRAGGRAAGGGVQKVFVVARSTRSAGEASSAPDVDGGAVLEASVGPAALAEPAEPVKPVAVNAPSLRTNAQTVTRQVAAPDHSIAPAGQAPADFAIDVARASGPASLGVLQPLVNALPVVSRQTHAGDPDPVAPSLRVSGSSTTGSSAHGTDAFDPISVASTPGVAISALRGPAASAPVYRQVDSRIDASSLLEDGSSGSETGPAARSPHVKATGGAGTLPLRPALTPIAAALDMTRTVTPVSMQYAAAPMVLRAPSAVLHDGPQHMPHGEAVVSSITNPGIVSNVSGAVEYAASTSAMPPGAASSIDAAQVPNVEALGVSASDGQALASFLSRAPTISRSHSAAPERGTSAFASAGASRTDGITQPPVAALGTRANAIHRSAMPLAAMALPFEKRPLSRAMQAASTFTLSDAASAFDASVSVSGQANQEAHSAATPRGVPQRPFVTTQPAGIIGRELSASADVIADRESARVPLASAHESAADAADTTHALTRGPVTPTLPAPAPVSLPLQHILRPTMDTPHDTRVPRAIDSAGASGIEFSSAAAGASGMPLPVAQSEASTGATSAAHTPSTSTRNARLEPIAATYRAGAPQFASQGFESQPAAALSLRAQFTAGTQVVTSTPSITAALLVASTPPGEPATPALSPVQAPNFAVKARIPAQAALRFPLLVQRDARAAHLDAASAALWTDRASAPASGNDEVVGVERIAEQYGLVSPGHMMRAAAALPMTQPSASTASTATATSATTTPAAPPTAVNSGAAADPNELAEQAWRLILDRLAIEQERRGYTSWA